MFAEERPRGIIPISSISPPIACSRPRLHTAASETGPSATLSDDGLFFDGIWSSPGAPNTEEAAIATTSAGVLIPDGVAPD
jgi:hypothetical protein